MTARRFHSPILGRMARVQRVLTGETRSARARRLRIRKSTLAHVEQGRGCSDRLAAKLIRVCGYDPDAFTHAALAGPLAALERAQAEPHGRDRIGQDLLNEVLR